MLMRLREIRGSWWYKIPDVRICGNCGKVATSDKRPFDVIGCYDQTAYAIEFKMEAGKVLPHQMAQLQLFAYGGGVSLVVHFRPGKTEIVSRVATNGAVEVVGKDLRSYLIYGGD